MHTLARWAYTSILGHPVVFYLGLITYTLILVTALVAVLRTKVTRLRRLPVSLHRRLALVAVVLATAHGLLTLSAYL